MNSLTRRFAQSHIGLRRCYSTAPTHIPSKAASTPTQVTIRRTQQNKLDVDQDKARYELLLSKGELISAEDGSIPTYEQWLEKTNTRRRRIRGVRTRKVTATDGQTSVTETNVVGRRIYLPNIVFKLVRNFTPPGQPYNPYEATFRVPRSVTKLDIRSYLMAVYGVETTYIRTDNYLAPMDRDHTDGMKIKRHDTDRTYKRAVVGLVKPFAYPEAVEDMSPTEKKEREDWLERMFFTKSSEKLMKQFTLRRAQGFRYRNDTTKQRGNIIEKVMQKRKEREAKVTEAVKELVASGQSPFGSGTVAEQSGKDSSA
ncbi:hypothetical protein FRC02_003280 [Tulasnella sp. 418]|nr:hypothetical protein FRC02_003280 [Tulasnella sp. 418]